MKTLTMFLIASFCLVNVSYAKCYIIIDKNKDIVSLSPEDDAVLSNQDWEKVITNDDYSVVITQLDAKPIFYKYQNGRFVKNVKKLSDDQIAFQAGIDKLNKHKEDRQKALEKIKLIANLTDDELTALAQ